MNRLSTRAGLLATIGLSAACSAAVAQTVTVQPEEAETIARDAYVYGFPDGHELQDHVELRR